LLLVVLCLAAAVRFWYLDSVPPGLTHDEAGHGQDAVAILYGARPIYETIGYGREPLYDYVVATAMAIAGRSDYLVLRSVSALFGVLAVAISYWWIRRAFGVWEALLTSGMLAVSFWGVSVSRQGLRSAVLPALLAGAVVTWWRGAFDSERRPIRGYGWFALSGLLVAATLWTYMAARVTWVIFLAMPLYLAFTDRPRFRQRWPGMALVLLVAMLAASPMFIWLWRHPGMEQRFSQLDEPLRRLAQGEVGQLWTNGLQALGMFTLRGDDLWMYNIPGRPLLGLVEGLLFYAGLLLAIWQWRRPQYALALIWLAAGLFPSVVTGLSASSTRAVGLLPVLYLFPALAIGSIKQRVKIPAIAVGVFVVLLVALMGVQTSRAYFGEWAEAPNVRVAYHTTLFEIGQSLKQESLPPDTSVVVSSITPGRFHDPYALDMVTRPVELDLRWVDARSALVFPPRAARLIVPALAPLDPALAALVAPYVDLVEARRLQPDDLNPGFDVYDWDSIAALQAGLLGLGDAPAFWADGAGFPIADPTSIYRPLELPADLGHTVALLGYEMASPVVAHGEELALITYWQILAVPDPALETVLFAHVLDPAEGGRSIAGQDRLDAPSWNWHVGEVFAQVHRIRIEADIPSGAYPIELGAYTRPIPSPVDPNPPTTRFPLYAGGSVVSDRILLPPVQVKEP
jgi:4-amino-4-deoxy-L-arabinose transferase-like glycosyltransferase